ncbi:MAG TPA: hypothetical protein VM578_02445 [Candidatus Saccharimonadales bacterium]|nr:hypothetical protein [Candidatus Saccharimonadales bacterium]
MDTTEIAVITLKGLPLSVRLQWPFHGNVSGADFHVLHGTAELGDGSGLHAQVAIHLTRVVAERLPGIEAEHTLGPVLGAIRRETDRKQLEFLRSDKRQPISLGGRFQDFQSKQWRFEQASEGQIRQAVLDRLFWVGSRLMPGALMVGDPVEALYLGVSEDALMEAGKGIEAEGLLRWVNGGALATEALLARSGEFEMRAQKAIEGIQQKHAFEQQRVIHGGAVKLIDRCM